MIVFILFNLILILFYFYLIFNIVISFIPYLILSNDQACIFFNFLKSNIILSLSIVLFTIWRRRKSVGQNIILTGLSDAGKTLIYARLLCSKFVQTHTSVKENIGDININNVSTHTVHIFDTRIYKLKSSFKLKN